MIVEFMRQMQSDVATHIRDSTRYPTTLCLLENNELRATINLRSDDDAALLEASALVATTHANLTAVAIHDPDIQAITIATIGTHGTASGQVGYRIIDGNVIWDDDIVDVPLDDFSKKFTDAFSAMMEGDFHVRYPGIMVEYLEKLGHTVELA